MRRLMNSRDDRVTIDPAWLSERVTESIAALERQSFKQTIDGFLAQLETFRFSEPPAMSASERKAMMNEMFGPLGGRTVAVDVETWARDADVNTMYAQTSPSFFEGAVGSVACAPGCPICAAGSSPKLVSLEMTEGDVRRRLGVAPGRPGYGKTALFDRATMDDVTLTGQRTLREAADAIFMQAPIRNTGRREYLSSLKVTKVRADGGVEVSARFSLPKLRPGEEATIRFLPDDAPATGWAAVDQARRDRIYGTNLCQEIELPMSPAERAAERDELMTAKLEGLMAFVDSLRVAPRRRVLSSRD